MFKVTLYKSMNVRSGEVPLRFRLREDKDVDLALETGIRVPAVDLQAFGSDGAVRPGLKEYNLELKKEIDRYCGSAYGQPYVYRSRRDIWRYSDAGGLWC